MTLTTLRTRSDNANFLSCQLPSTCARTGEQETLCITFSRVFTVFLFLFLLQDIVLAIPLPFV